MFSRGQIHRVLTSPVCRGLIRHRERTRPGRHPAIIGEDLRGRVQDKMQPAGARRRETGNPAGSKAGAGLSAPLPGKFRDETGDPLKPTHTKRHGRRPRCCVSSRPVTGRRQNPGWRLPAPAFEQAVATATAVHLETLAGRHAILRDIGAEKSIDATRKAQDLAAYLRKSGMSTISAAIASGEVDAGHLRIRFGQSALARLPGPAPGDIDPALPDPEAPFTCRHRGVEMRIVAGGRRPVPGPRPRPSQCAPPGGNAEERHRAQRDRRSRGVIEKPCRPHHPAGDALAGKPGNGRDRNPAARADPRDAGPDPVAARPAQSGEALRIHRLTAFPAASEKFPVSPARIPVPLRREIPKTAPAKQGNRDRAPKTAGIGLPGMPRSDARDLKPPQASNDLWVFDAILPGENRQRRVSFLARSGVLNIVRIRFHRRGHLPGKTVQHIRHLMHPTPLMSCSWKRLVQRVPETHGTISDCNFRCAGQAATFDVGQ